MDDGALIAKASGMEDRALIDVSIVVQSDVLSDAIPLHELEQAVARMSRLDIGPEHLLCIGIHLVLSKSRGKSVITSSP